MIIAMLINRSEINGFLLIYQADMLFSKGAYRANGDAICTYAIAFIFNRSERLAAVHETQIHSDEI